MGDFYTNRQSAANRCPRLAYSFVSLMPRQYYWLCDSYSCNGRSDVNIKKSAKTSYSFFLYFWPDWKGFFLHFSHTVYDILVLRVRPVLPKGAASVPRFTSKRRMPRSTNNISCGCYIAPILFVLRPLYCFTYSSRTSQ
jgi:hypothetical protein